MPRSYCSYYHLVKSFFMPKSCWVTPWLVLFPQEVSLISKELSLISRVLVPTPILKVLKSYGAVQRTHAFVSFLLSEKLRMASPEVVDTRSCVPRLRTEDGESQRLLGVAKNRAMAALQTCSAARCKWARIKEFRRTTSFCPAGKLARGSKHGVDCCTEKLEQVANHLLIFHLDFHLHIHD